LGDRKGIKLVKKILLHLSSEGFPFGKTWSNLVTSGLVKLMFYVQLDIKYAVSEMLFPARLLESNFRKAGPVKQKPKN